MLSKKYFCYNDLLVGSVPIFSKFEYKLMTDITYNGLPVYQNSARDDRYIIYNGELIIFYYSIMNIHINLANSWFLTHEISNSGLRELICSRQDKRERPDR